MMRVTKWKSGDTYGVRVGKKNRDKYFNNSDSVIKVKINDQFYDFDITSGFWNNCPEFREKIIHINVIRNWLEKNGDPQYFQLIPLNVQGTFELKQ
ncbi:MAG: hypothetical protein WCG16_10155 [Methylococcales bacterium]